MITHMADCRIVPQRAATYVQLTAGLYATGVTLTTTKHKQSAAAFIPTAAAAAS